MTDNYPDPTSRPYRSRAEADRLAAEYEASVLSREEFSNQTGVSVQSLARYLTRYRKRKPANGDSQRWVAVEVAAPVGTGNELAVLLSSGRRIEVKPGFDAGTLRQLVAVLERA